MKRKKLVIISHTEHYEKDGAPVGWGPTVSEINYLSDFWDEVWHVACLYNTPPPPSSRAYVGGNIRFVPLPPTGGARIRDKFNIIWNLPKTVARISRAIRGATEVQLRTPTGIGVYLLPAFSLLFGRKFTFWVKYAGDWAEKKAPLGYRFQRWWLKKNWARCKVTINGFWNDQPNHCFSFENPCLTGEDIEKGALVQLRKQFDGSFRLAFVGRLEDEKGVGRIIEALKEVDLSLIKRVDFIGDGFKRREYEEQSSLMAEKVFFHGFLDKAGVHQILSDAHFFLLPSTASEGFPKVIAEAACYGCLPVVSGAGSISHYVKDHFNGFLWRNEGEQTFSEVLKNALSTPPPPLEEMSKNVVELAKVFTFDNYMAKLELNILNAGENVQNSKAVGTSNSENI